MTRRSKTLVLSVLTLLVAASGATADIFHLGEGRTIEVAVVKETTETVFVDVGWSILAIPKKEILRREKNNSVKVDRKEKVEDIYRTKRRKTASVKENVDRVASSVVTVL